MRIQGCPRKLTPFTPNPKREFKVGDLFFQSLNPQTSQKADGGGGVLSLSQILMKEMPQAMQDKKVNPSPCRVPPLN